MALADFSFRSFFTDNVLLKLIGRLLSASQGLQGKDIFSDTATHTPAAPKEAWGAIQALADTTLNTIVDGSIVSGTLNGHAMSKGDIILGYFTSIKLNTGGKIAAYYV
jgi:hypothetical protein